MAGAQWATKGQKRDPETVAKIGAANQQRGRVTVPRVIALGECHQCGLIHDRCKGHKRGQPHIPCGLMPAKDQLVCKRYHGGGTSQALAGAQHRREEALAAKVLAKRLGQTVPGEIRNPSVALARLADEIRQTKETAGVMVTELLSAQQQTSTGIDIHPYVKLWERLIGEYRGILVDMNRIGIEDRLASVDELEAQMQLAAILAGLADAGVDTPAVRTAIAARLRAVEATGAVQSG